MPTIATDYKFIPLKTLVAIRDNGYRSSDAKFDYCPDLIDKALWNKNDKASRTLISKRMNEERELEMERLDLLSFLNNLNTKGIKFLNKTTLDSIVTDLTQHMSNHI